MEELELFFLDKIKPYEERIHKLEESERQKDYEITTLKHAIHNLNRILEEVKSKQGAASTRPQTTNARNPTAGKTPATTTPATAGTKPGARPGTAQAAVPGKTDTTKPGSTKKDTKPADPKKAGKGDKTDKAEAGAEEGNAESQEKKETGETAQAEEGTA